MCGLDVVIHLQVDLEASCLRNEICTSEPSFIASHQHRRDIIRCRGPDVSQPLEFHGPSFHLDMFSSVLQIQGRRVCKQPVVSESSGSILLWNGEFLNHSFSTDSDTQIVLSALDSCASVPVCLDSIEGPFSFVLFENRTNLLWFGKDKVGRRSLLVRLSADKRELVISSSGLGGGIELPAGRGIYSLDLHCGTLELHPWPTSPTLHSPDFLSGVATADLSELHNRFRKGIQRHMQSISRPSSLGILFSGGVDSAILASIAADVYQSCDHHLVGIDLINVACGGDVVSPDRATGLVTYSDLLSKFPTVPLRFICVNILSENIEKFESRILELSAPNDTHMDFNISSALWFGGRGEGRILSPSFVTDPDWIDIKSSIVSSESVESATENRRPKKVPIVGGVIVDALCHLCCKRKAKPGCIQTACKICCKTSGCIAHTPWVTPEVIKSVDLNEFVNRYLTEDSVVSDCRVLLVGHGADEVFGGYGRHETKNAKGGPEALKNELLLDLRRLWQRNLGRDDRILADSGRDVRHPFLDEAVIDFVSRLAVENLSTKNGENKPLLRQLARNFLGISSAAFFRKRAIQFGTRIAQRTNIAVFGSHSKGSGKTRYVVAKN